MFGAKIGARNERTVFFLGIQRERLAWKVQPGEARFGAELDWEKPWRGQVFGARLCTRNERKDLFFLGIQRERLAWKVQPREARFRPELDWEKPWRGQVFGAKMSETNGNKLDAREKWKKTVGGACSGLRLAQEMREQFFSGDSEGAFGMESATRFGAELDWEKPWRGQVFGAKMSETNGNKLDAREKRKKTVGGTCSGLRLAQEMREQFFF